jgi:uncharacterized membrane protein YjjP (DUF1212 family)
MPDSLPPELLSRCQAIADDANQGEALTNVDYLLFAAVTVLVPGLIVLLGVLL